MKTKFNGILTLLLAFMVQFTFAQERVISGVVSDEMGPVADISVLVKGTKTGTVTDFDGKYSIKAKKGDVLVFSHVSYGTIEKPVGDSNTIDVIVKETGETLDEIVITAMGIKKKKINDLSSSTKIEVQTIEKSNEAGLLQGMAGKTSGLNIVRNGGDPGAGSFVQIRGANTILGSDVPLIVLDGVLISNTNSSGGVDGVAAQSRLNDIPASDIESVTVLKGAQAAALYGSAAASGVIIMTTKSGKISGSKKKWTVDLRSSFMVDEINIEWDLNTTYGQGFNGFFIQDFLTSYGDKISSRSGGDDVVDTTGEYFVADSGNTYYPILSKNSRENFNESNRNAILGRGFTSTHDVSLQYAGENGNTFISFSNWDQNGIIVNNSNYERNTFRFNNTTNYSDKLTGKVSASYITSNTDLIQQGSNLNGLYLGYLRNPADFDIRDYRGTRYDGFGGITYNAQRAYRSSLGVPAIYNNPLWTINEQRDNANLNRFIITPELSYKIKNNLSLVARYNVDSYTNETYRFVPFNSAGGGDPLFVDTSLGSYRKGSSVNKSQFATLLLQGDNKINEDIKVNWVLGYAYEKYLSEFRELLAENFINPSIELSDVFSIGDLYATRENQRVRNLQSKEAKTAGFASLDFELYNQFLLGVTGRIEKSSTLIDDTFFFPSASFGWKFSELFEDNDFFNFGKLRFTYGEVATAPSPYLNNTFVASSTVNSTWGDALAGSAFGGTFNPTDVLGNPDLSIERVKEFEVGTDLEFWNRRINFGFTYYDRKTVDALVRQSLPGSTGFTSTFTNDGLITNKGIEADLGIKLIRSKDINWKVNFNFSRNRNMVEELPGGNVFLNGFTGTSSQAVEGHPMGVLMGGTFLRDSSGSYILDANGFPQYDSVAGDQVIGDPNADWRGGINTIFNWKNFNLSATFETSQGNDVWNGTKGVLKFFGREQSTAGEVTVSAADAATIVDFNGAPINTLPGAVLNNDGSFTIRGTLEDFGAGPVLLDQAWYIFGEGGGFGNVAEQFIEDASWIRLRELTIGYDFNSKILKKAGITNANFSVSGRNLIVWTDVEGFDPESNLTGASKGRGLEYFTNPATKSYNFTLKLRF